MPRLDTRLSLGGTLALAVKHIIAGRFSTTKYAPVSRLAPEGQCIADHSSSRPAQRARLGGAWVTLLIGCILGCTERDTRLVVQETPGSQNASHSGIERPNLSGMHLQLAVDDQSAWSWPCRVQGIDAPYRLRVPVQVIRAGRWQLSVIEPDPVDGLPGRTIAQQTGAVAAQGRSPLWQTLTWDIKGDLDITPTVRWVLAVEGSTILRLAARSEAVWDAADGVFQSTGITRAHWIQWPLFIAHDLDDT